MTFEQTRSEAPSQTGLILVSEPQPFRDYLRSMWQRRQFAAQMPFEDLRSQHMDTVLGQLWHLLNPLLLTGVYYLIFGVALDLSRGVDNFIAFLTIGIFTFHYTQKSVIAASRSITSNEALIRSLQFPRATLPLGSVLAQTLALGPTLVVMLAIATATGERPALSWVLVPAMFALQAVFNLGAALFAARANHRFRDVENVLPFVFRLLFYGSGVLYPLDLIVGQNGGAVRLLFDLNPLYGFVTLMRFLVMEAGTVEVSPVMLIAVGLWTVLILLAGGLVFVRAEREYANG